MHKRQRVEPAMDYAMGPPLPRPAMSSGIGRHALGFQDSYSLPPRSPSLEPDVSALKGVPLSKCVSLLDTPELVGLMGPPDGEHPTLPADGNRPFLLGDGESLCSDSTAHISAHPTPSTAEALLSPCTEPLLASDAEPDGELSPLQLSSMSTERSVSLLQPANGWTGERPLRRKESLACLDALLQLDGRH